MNRGELAAKLGVLREQRQTEAVPLAQRWPPEFIQRLRFALDAGLIDGAQMKRHLREDPAAAEQLLATSG